MGRSHLLDAQMLQAALERGAIPAVAIVNRKSWRPLIPSEAFGQLPIRPLRGWRLRHRYVQNLSVDVSDHEKDVQSLEQHCRSSHKPIYSIHAVSTRAIPGLAVDYGGGSCT
jgi:hypothetical protein